jgi:hypothetical protein
MQMIDRCLASWSLHSASHGAARLTAWAMGLMLWLLTAHTSAAQVTLTWNASPSAGVDGYWLYYGTQSHTYTARFDMGPETSATVTGLASGQTYYFAVTAYNSTAGTESTWSNEVPIPPVEVLGPVAAYSFNAGSGTTVTDVSGHGNHGTISGATWTTAGRFGNALVFDGRSAMVTIPDALSLRLTTAMTLEAWVQPSTVTSEWRDVIYKGDDN